MGKWIFHTILQKPSADSRHLCQHWIYLGCISHAYWNRWPKPIFILKLDSW